MIYFLGAIVLVYLCIVSPAFRLATAIVLIPIVAFTIVALIASGHH